MKIVLAAIVILMVILGIVLWQAVNMLYRLALDPKGDRSVVMAAPHNSFTPEEEQAGKDRLKLREKWLESVTQEEVSIYSEDGLKLIGYCYQSLKKEEKTRWVVICHGYDGKAVDMQDQARVFSEMGFHILMPDARSHGKSQGDSISMGWLERRDIVKWIEFILKRDPDADLVLYGISMGAATVMMTAGEKLPGNVKVVIEDCGYTSVWDEFAYQLKQLYHLPAFPLMYLFEFLVKKRQGFGVREASALNQLKKCHLPILCIHGTKDTFVPVGMVDIIFEQANEPKQKLLIEGAEHGGANVVGKEQYWDTVRDFIFTHISR